MKKIRQNYLSSAIIAALIMSGCAGLTKMRDDAANVGYQVDPNPLETHAGEVAVTIDTRFPEKYFNKKAVVVATPVLRSDGNETEFSSTTLQGEKVDANNKVILYAGGNYTYTGSIPYDENMMKSELVVKMSAQIGDKTPVVFESRKIADGVIATSTLVQVEPKAIILPDSFRRVIPETYMADIHYVINQSNVRSSELKSEDIQNLQKDIVKADTTPMLHLMVRWILMKNYHKTVKVLHNVISKKFLQMIR